MKNRKIIFLSFLVLTLTQNCTTTSKVYYPYNDKKRVGNGLLEDTIFISLKSFLQKYTQDIIKDTIIIKYDYNNETCWNNLDESDDERIMKFVKRKQQSMKQVSQSRKNISLFNFREPGDNLNKLKLWDSTIIIDNRKELYNLLFPHKFNCGNSILILPDKRFIYIGSDPHSEAFYLTGKQIEGILNDK